MKRTIEIEIPDGKKAVWKVNKAILEKIESQLPKTLNMTRKELIMDIGKTCHKQLIKNVQSRKQIY